MGVTKIILQTLLRGYNDYSGGKKPKEESFAGPLYKATRIEIIILC